MTDIYYDSFRPNSEDYNVLQQAFYNQIQKLLEERHLIDWYFQEHELRWGVPCGPTLTMLSNKIHNIIM